MSIRFEMADVIENAASLALNVDESDRVRRHELSHADFDEQVIVSQLDSARPVQWLSQAIGYYLSDCAYELKAIAHLLREGIVGGSLEVLVRAVVERVARIMWLLDLKLEYKGRTESVDTPTTPRIRALRASFEALVSAQMYRRGVDSLGAPSADQKQTAKVERSIREDVEKWFPAIVKPLLNPNDPNSFDPSVNTWTIGGERYPTYSDLSVWAIAGEATSVARAKGTYAALSGWSHPNFIASMELRSPNHSYDYDFDFLQRLLQLALFGYLKALKAWSGYYDFNADRFTSECDRLAATWEATSPQPH